MKIVKNFVDESKYNIKCPYSMKPTRIVVHNTANDATAQNEIAYMRRNNNEVSFHYAVDDVEVVQGIPENRNAWHASDGGNGKGNREGIAIEICYSKSGGDRFIKAEQNAVELIVDILKRYGWGVDRVTKHQDYTNKYCPHRTLDMGWSRFLAMIVAKMNENKSTYRVKSGDSLWKIAQEQLGNGARYTEIKALNGLTTDTIHTGQVLELPTKASTNAGNTSTNASTNTGNTSTNASTKQVKVGANVKVKKGAKTYEGKSLASFVYGRTHQVKSIKGDRVVITFGGVVVCAIKATDLTIV